MVTAEQEQRPDPAWSGGEKASSVFGAQPRHIGKRRVHCVFGGHLHPGALAHPVEHLICNQKAASSRLAGSTPPNPGRFTLSGMTGSPTTSKGGAAL